MFFKTVREDVATVFHRDPAAKTWFEVLTCYPGLHALWAHRVAHRFYRAGLPLLARLISHVARQFTGVEIHPGATIGRRFFIDHGMGIVIGETTVIGDDCLMYQGAVLGGTSLRKEKRHPTLEEGVIVGANACVLGPVTIGDHVRIGSGSVVVKDVPPGSTVVGIPGRVQKRMVNGRPDIDLQHSNIPDPIADVVQIMLNMQSAFESRLGRLEKEHGIEENPLLRPAPEEGDGGEEEVPSS
jgi:serine O-acetyltransferase